MQKYWRIIFFYSAAHLFVDFACAFLMFRSIAKTPDWHLCILLYNFCAFALQMPLGIIADRANRNFLFAATGCVLVAAAYGFRGIPVMAVVIAGLGNAMFHIGGGVDILNISKEKSGALGLFVSPGAFGVYFGTIAGKGGGLTAFPVILTLAMSALLIFAIHRTQEKYPENAEFSLDTPNPSRLLAAALCLFFVVCLRSYVGLTLHFPWKSTGSWGMVLVCAVVLGKTFGGFAADRFGAKGTVVVSLGIAALLFLFPQIPLAGVMSVLLFNMTMPVTLWVMAKSFPGAKGFSFGLLTFALFLGFLPVYLGFGINSPLLPATIAAISLALLLVGLRKAGIRK